MTAPTSNLVLSLCHIKTLWLCTLTHLKVEIYQGSPVHMATISQTIVHNHMSELDYIVYIAIFSCLFFRQYMASPTMVFNIKFSVFGFRKNYKSRDDEFPMDPKIGSIIKISIGKYIIHPGIQPTDISHEEQKIRSIQLISRDLPCSRHNGSHFQSSC